MVHLRVCCVAGPGTAFYFIFSCTVSRTLHAPEGVDATTTVVDSLESVPITTPLYAVSAGVSHTMPTAT